MTSRVDHIGEIVRRVRSSRGLTQGALAQLCDVDRVTIVRLESGDTLRAANKRRIVGKIADVLSGPHVERAQRLTPIQEILLSNLVEADIAREQAEREYGWINLDTLFDRRRSPELIRLVDSLARESRPAMIVDPLLFIHAMNGMVPKMFELDPQKWLYSWDMWHLIGGKMRRNAPPRDRHVDDDHYVATTAFFLQRSTSNRFLFTPQMGALLDRLDQLSDEHDHPFVQRWDLATKFQLTLALNNMSRDLELQDGRTLRAIATHMDDARTRPSLDAEVTFTLLGWDVIDDDGRNMFTTWRGQEPKQELLFARDFDKGGLFHVNTWPEIRSPL